MESLQPLFRKVLAAQGLPTGRLKIVDGSGLSRLNAVPARFVNRVLFKIEQGSGTYSIIKSTLPVSGKYGSLSTRFSQGKQASAAGLVRAKTGWILTGYSLAGYLTAADGTPLIFTVYNLKSSVNSAHRAALDNLVYRFHRCGAALVG